MADGLGDIFVGLDDFRKFSADSFLQNANRLIGDVWTQHTIDNIPQMAGDIWTQHVTSQLPNLTSMLAPPAPPPPPQMAPAAPPDPFASPTFTSTTPTIPAAPAPSAGADSGTLPPSTPPAPAAGVPGPVTETTAGLSGGGQGTGNMTDRAQGILAGGAQAASWLGDQGQRALQAVLVTEGGLTGARGDQGSSASPLQLFGEEGGRRGQLNNYAEQHGLTLAQARDALDRDPMEAIRFGIGTPDKPGYLAAAILDGLKQGLSGPDLATYAQRHGQVSVSPERAGQNWQALFGAGQELLGGAGQAVQSVASTVGGALQGVAPAVADKAGALADQAGATGQSWLDMAKSFLGKPYIWGSGSGAGGRGTQDIDPSTGLPRGFDCSGFVSYILQNGLGIDLPAQTAAAYGSGKLDQIDAAQAQPGDVVFYNMNSGDPHMQHMALYMGNGKIIEAGGTGSNVNISDVGAVGPPTFMRPKGGVPREATNALSAAGSVAQPSPSVFGQTFMGANQTAQPAPTAPQAPPQPPKSIWDQLGSGISDVFKNVFGGGGSPSTPPPPPEGGGFGAVPPGGQNPLDQIGQGISNAASSVFGGLGQAAQRGQQNLAARGVQLDQPGTPTLPETPILSQPRGLAGAGIQLDQPGSPVLPPTLPDLLDTVANNVPQQIPVVAGALRGAAGMLNTPTPVEAAQTASAIEQKYGGGLQPKPGGGVVFRAPDYSNITPEDREALSNATFAVGGVAAPIGPEGPLAPRAGNINLAKYPTEVQDVIQAAAPTIPESVTRGVVPDAVVRDLAQKAGTTVQDVVTKWQPGQAQNAETLYALRDALANQGRSVLDAQQALRSNPGSADAQAALVQALTEHRAVQEVVQGTTAEAGRALRQFTQPVTGDIAALQQLQTLAAKTGQSADDLAQRLATMDLSDPVHMGDIAKALNPPRLPPNEALPTGAQPGQLSLGTAFGQELPTGSPRPTGMEAPLPATPQPGQLQFGSELPVGGPRPTGRERLGPSGRQPGQQGLGIGEQFQQDLMTPSAGSFEPPNVPTPAQTPEQADYLRRALTLKALREGTPLPDIPYQGPRGTNLQPDFDPSRAFDYDKLAQMRQDFESRQPQLDLNAPPKPNRVDKVISYTVNNMLSGVGTQVQNIMGNLSATVSRPLVTAGGGLTGDAGLFVDAARDVAAMGATFSEAFSRAGQTLKTGVRSGQPEQLATSAFAPQLRLLSAGDEFFRTLNAAGGQAAEVSRLLRENPSLSFEETLAKYQGRILAAGEDAAARSVYEKGGTGWGDMIAQARSQLLRSDDPSKKALGVILNAVVPFSKVPDTILTLGVRGLPGINEAYGIGKTVSLLRQGEVYAARREAGATALLTAANLGILAQALQGNITGDGPDDPTLLSQMMAARDQNGNALWRPHSVKLPDGRWIDYGFLGPMEIHMAAIANVVEGAREQGGSINPQPVQMTINRLTKTIGNLWYLRGLSDVLSAISSGQLATPSIANSIEAVGDRFVWQGSLLNEIRQLTDPTVRDPQDPLSREANRIPGVDQLVPARPDPTTGQPLQRPQDVLSIMSRGSPPGMSPGSGSAEILSRSDVAVSPAPKQITVGRFPIQLTHDEQQQYTTLRGQLIDQMVAPLAQDNAFRTAPQYVREQVLRKLLDQASSAASKMMIGQIDPNSLNQRLQQSQQTITTNTPFLPEDTSSTGRVPALAR